jgi:hypothetical protein
VPAAALFLRHIPQTHSSKPVKTDDSSTTTWITMGGIFTTSKTGIMFVTFSPPEFNLKKKM